MWGLGNLVGAGVVYGFYPGLPGLGIILWLAGGLHLILRINLDLIESRFYKNIINQQLQEKWANSFATTTDHVVRSLTFIPRSLLIRLALTYGTLTVLTSIFYVELNIQAMKCSGEDWSPPVIFSLLTFYFCSDRTPSLLLVAKCICTATFLELLSRIIMILTVGWKSFTVPTSNLQRNSADIDYKYAWPTTTLKIVVLPTVIVGIAWIWLSLQDYATDERTRRWYILMNGVVLLISLVLARFSYFLYRSEIAITRTWLGKRTRSVLSRMSSLARRIWYGHPDREVQL